MSPTTENTPFSCSSNVRARPSQSNADAYTDKLTMEGVFRFRARAPSPWLTGRGSLKALLGM
jgi:hypothetical protein